MAISQSCAWCPRHPRCPSRHPPGVRLGEFDDGQAASWRGYSVRGRITITACSATTGRSATARASRQLTWMPRPTGRAAKLYPLIPAAAACTTSAAGGAGRSDVHPGPALPQPGITISRDQFRYVAGLGLPVRWGDVERRLPPGHFDCAVLLEHSSTSGTSGDCSGTWSRSSPTAWSCGSTARTHLGRQPPSAPRCT